MPLYESSYNNERRILKNSDDEDKFNKLSTEEHFHGVGQLWNTILSKRCSLTAHVMVGYT
ncbi:hypothetical protein TSUD_281180 [Trifolium subterraneum]|uniref:Uncharacterized protein n=1 Tax=Trifolium subterraneum TaxID=3900 RepID=A0A2Z6P156_TRISU|nr:hypothetical protein TSUD_281180 [Trifolium subterraneum]